MFPPMRDVYIVSQGSSNIFKQTFSKILKLTCQII